MTGPGCFARGFDTRKVWQREDLENIVGHLRAHRIPHVVVDYKNTRHLVIDPAALNIADDTVWATVTINNLGVTFVKRPKGIP